MCVDGRFSKIRSCTNVNIYGFRVKHSTELQLLHMVHNFTSSINKKIRTDAVLLETFDKVSHHYLIDYYGVKTSILQWISSFLNVRTQFVTCNGSHSSTVDVISGVPQGAILGPLLFKYTLMICLNALYPPVVYLPMTVFV